MKAPESEKVWAARRRRAEKLADAFIEWRSLADRNSYPKSLVEIAENALTHEYQLGRTSARKGER